MIWQVNMSCSYKFINKYSKYASSSDENTEQFRLLIAPLLQIKNKVFNVRKNERDVIQVKNESKIYTLI